MVINHRNCLGQLISQITNNFCGANLRQYLNVCSLFLILFKNSPQTKTFENFP